MDIPADVALGDIIEALKAADPERSIRWGFGAPRSYRRDYSEVAFEPVEHTTVGEMLAHAESALGREFEGYKGGAYTMSAYTYAYIARWGESGGDRIGPTLLRYWLSEA